MHKIIKQPIIHIENHHPVFIRATVTQVRNLMGQWKSFVGNHLKRGVGDEV